MISIPVIKTKGDSCLTCHVKQESPLILLTFKPLTYSYPTLMSVKNNNANIESTKYI